MKICYYGLKQKRARKTVLKVGWIFSVPLHKMRTVYLHTIATLPCVIVIDVIQSVIAVNTLFIHLSEQKINLYRTVISLF